MPRPRRCRPAHRGSSAWRSASPAPARHAARRRRWSRLRRGAAGLYRALGCARSASGSPALCRALRRAGAGGADRGDGRGLRRLPAGLPGGLRSGRCGRHGDALLPALREYPDRAGDAAADPLRAGTRWQPTLAMLEALDPPPAGLILASPCNPAGTMLPPAEFIAIAALVRGNGVRLVSDEIYHGLTYGTVRRPAAAVSARHRGEQLLQVFLDDRLADRLAGAAGGPGPAGGMPGAEHVHQRPPRRPGGGRGGLRLPAGAGGQYRRLPPEPRGLLAACRRRGSTGSRRRMAPSTFGWMSGT